MGAVGARKEIAMRSREFLVCCIGVVAVALMVAPVGAQIPEPAGECDIGNWHATVNYFGPVDCADPNDPDNPGHLVPYADGSCTGVQYTVTGNKPLAHSAILAYNPAYLYPGGYVSAQAGPSGEVQARCDGDEATDSGIGSCHEQAIRFNPDDVVDGPFWIVVDGLRQASATTLTLKSNKTYRCEILGVGDLVDDNVLPDGCVPSCGNFDEEQSLIKTEIIDFKGCKARFEYNLASGAVLNFGAACDTSLFPTVFLAQCCAENPNDPNCTTSGDVCEFPTFNAEDQTVSVYLDGIEHTLNFGDGLVSIGDESCSCRVIGGRVYCWGRPCPQ